MKNALRHLLTMAVLLFGLTNSFAAEVTLNANTNLNNGATLYSITPSAGDGTRENPWQYAFAPDGGGLDLVGHRIFTTNNPSASDSLILDLGGETIAGTGGLAIVTYPGSGADRSAGRIVITNAGNIACGTIDTTANRNGWGDVANAGSIRIGHEGRRAGNIRVANLYANTRGAFDNSNLADGSAGSVAVYGSGDVLIEDDAGNPGDILTECYRRNSGVITVNHSGSFRARNIHTRNYCERTSFGRAMAITINGNGPGTGPSGPFEAGNILAGFSKTAYASGLGNGDVSISGYTEALIGGNVETFSAATDPSHSLKAGHLQIVGIVGDIVIQGGIDAEQRHQYADSGYVRLESLNGTIRLNDLDMDKMLYIRFEAGSGKSHIEGVLTNFTGTTETPDSRLRAPANHRVYYKAKLNPHLNDATYPLKGLDGNADGGTLMAEPARGTVLRFN